jgi:hypothetical protein
VARPNAHTLALLDRTKNRGFPLTKGRPFGFVTHGSCVLEHGKTTAPLWNAFRIDASGWLGSGNNDLSNSKVMTNGLFTVAFGATTEVRYPLPGGPSTVQPEIVAAGTCAPPIATDPDVGESTFTHTGFAGVAPVSPIGNVRFFVLGLDALLVMRAVSKFPRNVVPVCVKRPVSPVPLGSRFPLNAMIGCVGFPTVPLVKLWQSLSTWALMGRLFRTIVVPVTNETVPAIAVLEYVTLSISSTPLRVCTPFPPAHVPIHVPACPHAAEAGNALVTTRPAVRNEVVTTIAATRRAGPK